VTVATSLPLPAESEKHQNLGAEIQRLQMEVRYLRELLRLARIAKYGPGSEQLSDEQLELLELEPGVRAEEVPAESQKAQLQLPLPSPRKEGHGRQNLPAHLARVERIIACTQEECVCGHCGREKTLIGYESSEQLDVEPAKYFVRVTKREKRACQHCPEGGVACAPAPAQIIDKSLATDRLVIETIVSKYLDHLPLYRQSAILERDTGIELSRNTLCGWVMRVGELLQPIAGAMAQELLAGQYLQADETPVAVQLKASKGKNHQAYLWQYSTPGGAVVFDFQLGRSREGPKRFLGNYEGIYKLTATPPTIGSVVQK
jgi:transposase